jgi:short-subunit dehydrogenase
VTGASSGIGMEFARQLAAAGLNLVLVARRLSLLEELGQQLATSYGIQYRAAGLDLAEPGFLTRLEAITHDLDVGLLVSNAGALRPGAFLQLETTRLHQLVGVNVVAHLDLAHHFGQRLAARGRGGLLLVASTAGLQGVPFSAEYAAAKGYVLNLAEALHVELEPTGVHVTALLPGAVATPMLTEFGLDLLDQPIKPMSPEQCVAEGFAALRVNRATHIAGRMNRVIAAVVPRPMATRMFGKMAERALAKRVVSATAQGDDFGKSGRG